MVINGYKWKGLSPFLITKTNMTKMINSATVQEHCHQSVGIRFVFLYENYQLSRHWLNF